MVRKDGCLCLWICWKVNAAEMCAAIPSTSDGNWSCDSDRAIRLIHHYSNVPVIYVVTAASALKSRTLQLLVTVTVMSIISS